MPRAIVLVGALAGAVCAGTIAAAQTSWPVRAVKIVVPAAGGGGTDVVARILSDQFQHTFGQQFFVENRGGAGGIIGADAVARSPADGYTLLVTASPIAINHLTAKNVPYDVLKDFAPITLLVTLPNIIAVHPSVAATSLAELVALAKRRPGELTYASAGIGTNPHFAMELFKSMAGIDIRHVPYRGAAPAVNDTIAGSVHAVVTNMLTGKPQAEAGTLRGLAVTSRTRVEGLPNVETMAEAGFPKYEASQWYGFLAPAGTPMDIVQRLQREAARVLALAEIKMRLAQDAAEPAANTPAEFAAFLREDVERWTAVAKAAGIKP